MTILFFKRLCYNLESKQNKCRHIFPLSLSLKLKILLRGIIETAFFSPTDVICKEFIFQNDPENCIFLYNTVW